MDEMVRAIKGLNRENQSVPQTVQMDHQNMGGMSCTETVEGCQHSDHVQKGKPIRMGYTPRNISSFLRRQDLCSDHTEQTLRP